MGAGLYYHNLFWGCKTNKPCDICRWVRWAECLPSSLSIVWEREVKHLEIAFTDRRLNQIRAHTMGISYLWSRGRFLLRGARVLALLSLTKATFDDQGLNLSFPNGMGMSSPFDVAVLTQCHLFPGFVLVHAMKHCHCQSTVWYLGLLARECQH